VYRAHAVALSAEFIEIITPDLARKVLRSAPGINVVDDPSRSFYPTPLDVAGNLNCQVGRIRQDRAFDNGLSMWVVGDQLLKGAALNAVQILKELISL
jgi:aspartate-semialdehyde dehydrogenase